MLSRRNVRVKVMQQLYSLSQDKDLKFAGAIVAYHHSIDESFKLYLLNLFCIIKVCYFAAEDVKIRQTKHIKTEEDKVFTDKLYSNPLIHSLVNNKFLNALFTKEGYDTGMDNDLLKKIYKEFIKEEAYQNYILKKDNSASDHEELLLELYRYCRKNELFNEIMDDRFAGWADDKSLVIGALKKTLKALPCSDAFYKEYVPDSDTVNDFGEFLLKTTHLEDQTLQSMINPVLENWDSERVALIDMILIKMGIVELMNFSTIPSKVTLNEYVELSKQYSTDKSKEFVNGVLDKILKDLQENGKIVKEGRGLLEE